MKIPVGTVMHSICLSQIQDLNIHGWIACSEKEVSREQYPDLFAVIGTAFGTGDGSTTFGLPPPDGSLFPFYIKACNGD